MRVKILFIILFFVVVGFAPNVLAQQDTNGATSITDLMGQRPSNSYYQNPSNLTQTQGSGISTGSANASVLQQQPTGTLKVDAPAPTAPPEAVKVNNSVWRYFAGLAVLFLTAGIVMFILGVKNKQIKPKAQLVQSESPQPEEIIKSAEVVKPEEIEGADTAVDKPVKTEPKKLKKKKNKSKVKRRKKKR